MALEMSSYSVYRRACDIGRQSKETLFKSTAF